MNEEQAAGICQALSDPNRMKIIMTLTGGSRCACQLLEDFAISQPTLSHHMRILCDCGLVTVRKDGRWCHYTLDCDTLTAFRGFIAGLSCRKGGCR